MNNRTFVLGVIALIAVGLGFGAFMFTRAPAPTGAAVALADLADDDPSVGPSDAAITVVEFGDLQCPYTARFHLNTLPALLKDYAGSVRWVLRDMPIPQRHPRAVRAAEAAECAGDRGKHFEFADLAFSNQDALSDDDLAGYAYSLGLDKAEFLACLEAGTHTQEVQRDLNAGRAFAVKVTPTFFINGKYRIDGNQDYSTFAGLFDKILEEGAK